MSAPQARLRGRRVAVVGGTSGIGRAIAAAAAAQEAEVVLGGRDARRRDDALHALRGGRASALEVDARDANSVAAFFERAGPVDHLVASIAEPETGLHPFLETEIAVAVAHFEQTFWTAYRLALAYARHTERMPERSILFVIGGLSRRPIPGKSMFTSAQWALEGLARALIKELAPLRVNVLVPGLVKSERWQSMPADVRDAMFARAGEETPVGFIADAEPVAALAVEALANPYINGASLVVDGGWTVAS